ncbi:hypothetical protein LSG31_01140 [Fodinisporobacter ferrooxydans]|uniref:Uncharacterized protein n=1 Tax=Fodinisporobacter ferrooxydans TaxID=2901836 RepID=A0ABY4CKR4_9BACL|nr:hypothetical protein LSG31_01140 [Alicyclobacillaceae bacterium MYW30-H2]
MRKTFLSLLMGVFILFMSSSLAFAHAVGGAPANAPTLIKQSIAFVEGVHDASQAEMKAELAMFAVGNDMIDKSKLQQAIAALQQSKLEDAKVLLAESLKVNPKTSDVLAFDLQYTPSAMNTFFLILAVILILIGAYIVYKVKWLAKPRIVKNNMHTHSGMQM